MARCLTSLFFVYLEDSRIIGYPGHQIEITVDKWQPLYDTNYTISYVDPKLRTASLKNNNQKN